MSGRTAVLVVLVLGAILFALFVWPTRYEPQSTVEGADGSLVERRIDRLTDQIQVKDEAGNWVEAPEAKEVDPEYTPERYMTADGVSKYHQARDDMDKINDVADKALKAAESPLSGN